MRVPNIEHTARPWRIHKVAEGFRLEDVWALPGEGGPDDFRRLVDVVASYDPTRSSSSPARALFGIRRKLGEWLGLDDEQSGIGGRVPTLRDRLPADLRGGERGPDFAAVPFTSLYLTDDEWAAESANRTMHGVLHLGRVPGPAGSCRAQLAVYVKPNGLLGQAYMAAIKPFRYLVVYPKLMEELARRWQEAGAASGQD